MKRLIKKSNLSTYELVSPITVNFGNESTWRDYTNDLRTSDEYEDIIQEAVADSMNELGPRGLAQYFDPTDYGLEEELIESIIVTVKNCQAVTIVKSYYELSDDDLEKIKEYIEGQFADGWGESFEQQTLTEFEDYYDSEELNEETGEYYTDEVAYTVTITASFWTNEGWYINLK